MLQRVTARAEKPPRSVKKTFHLNVILSLLTGLTLSREGTAGPQRLVAFMMETDADDASAAEHADEVKACLEEQLPFLDDVNLEGLYNILKVDPSPDNPYLSVWREMQALRYGEEHEVIPLARWQRLRRQQVREDETVQHDIQSA
jgi:hypothetical protein